ncbi:MAG TPA: Calx-beta domain-containing protein [Pyrinomonadaceae bacterium]|nr:Calx-beta domain-containing protein [Pyrinomonadaceae bacterium]
MIPRINTGRFSLRQKLALLITLAVLLNGLAPAFPSLGSKAMAAPAPQATPEVFVRHIPLLTRDIVYDKSSQKIYASVPSYAGSLGNTITPVDPVTGALGASVFVGSEPAKLAISDNGQYVYANLEGASAIRRFDTASQSAGLQFTVPGSLSDMQVLTGKPESIAVTTGFTVSVYDNDVRRPTVANINNFSNVTNLEPSASPDLLYGSYRFGASPVLKISLAPSGATVSGSMANSGQGDFRYDNGRLYFSTGQVLDAATGTLLGTFPGVDNGALLVPDADAGRVYFLRGNLSNNQAELRAYDMNTFLQVGSVMIPNVVGTPSSLVRWGKNGLAFRSGDSTNNQLTSGQITIVQTSLIPSTEPVPPPLASPTPSPTPTPAPTPENSVTQIPLPSTDLIYDKSRQLLYASVPSLVGASGNSITPINPSTASIGTPIYVGSEPGKLALTDDSQYLYTVLNGAGSVRRVDLVNQSAGLQFYLGGVINSGPNGARDIATLPGKPESLAVVRGGPLVIYDNDVQRPTASPGVQFSFITSSSSASTLYGFASFGADGLQKVSLDAGGVTSVAQVGNIGTSNGDLFFDDGLIYMNDGRVVDPSTGTLKGTFFGINSSFTTALVCPDSSTGRVYFLTNSGGSTAIIRAYDKNTFLLIGTLTIPNITGAPSSLVRWGSNGLAFRTNGTTTNADPVNANSKIYLVQTALVSSSAPITPTVAPTPQPTPFPPAIEINQLTLPSNDIIYDQSRQLIYASVPGSAGSNGNTITQIDPAAASIGTSVFIGSEPSKLALSDNNQYLYAGLDGAGAVRRLDLATLTPGLQFSLGNSPSGGAYRAGDIEVMPGAAQTVAIARRQVSPVDSTIVVYDNDVQRPAASASVSNSIEFPTADTIFGYDASSSAPNIRKFSVSAQGVILSRTTPGLGGSDIQYADGRLYMGSGQVFDSATGNLLGKFTGVSNFNSVVCPDPANGRIYFLELSDFGLPSALTLKAFDINTFLPLGAVQVAPVAGQPTSLIRWGTNGLAFRTGPVSSGTSQAGANQIYLIRSSLVSSEPIPPKIRFTAPTYSFNEASSNSVSITVARYGDNSSQASVDYATSDGTAVAGTDYTAKSGTITFAPGESTKTISISLLNDNVFEIAETFNVTLTNGVGAALAAPVTAVVSIVDDDLKPSMIFSGGLSTITEPATGMVEVKYNVQLTQATSQVVTVDYSTADGTALAGSDYVQTSGTITFNPLEINKTLTIQVKADDLIESTETFYIDLKNATNTRSAINFHVPINIADAPRGSLQLSAANYSAQESAGNAEITVSRKNGSGGTVTVNFATANGTAVAGSDYTSVSGTLTFAPGETSKTVNIPLTDDTSREDNETINLLLSSAAGGATLGTPVSAVLTIVDNDAPTIGLSSNSYNISEDANNTPQGYASLIVEVKRAGDTSAPATVQYSTSDTSGGNECDKVTGQASQRCDYVTQAGTLRFAAGESTKQIQIPIVADGYIEGAESFSIKLQSPTGASLGTVSEAAITIEDKGTATNPTENPYLNNSFFVRMNYMDFLSREPDAEGFATWTGVLNNCGPEKGFLGAPKNCDRAFVTHGFVASPEFTDRGYEIHRIYEVGAQRLPRYSEFVLDMASMSGAPGSQELDQNTRQFAESFTQKQEFINKYGDVSAQAQAEQLITKLEQTAGVTLPATTQTLPGQPPQYNRQELINKRQSGEFTLGQTLRAFIEQKAVYDRFFERGFVTMMYFGFLRRDPDLNDPNLAGWTEWVYVFTNGGAERGRPDILPRDIHHLTFGFIYSEEYRKRFGQP